MRLKQFWSSWKLPMGDPLFAFERPFLLQSYEDHFCSLLFVSRAAWEGEDGPQTRVDVLFQSVRAMHIRRKQPSMIVRFAKPEEAEAVWAQHPTLTPAQDDRVFMVGDGDYLIAGAVGYYEDERPHHALSHFAEGWANPDGAPWERESPFFPTHRGLGYERPSLEELHAALDGPPKPLRERQKVGVVYVVLVAREGDRSHPLAAFASRQEAETYLASEAVRAPADRWIELVKLAL